MKRLLPVYPWPMPPRLVAELEKLDDLNPVEALPGGPGPILALRSAPPFVCDAIVVTDPERVAEAVHVILGDGLSMVTVRDMITTAFGLEYPIIEKMQTQRTGPVFK